jgi:DNA-binding IclR family transcriptional regulator
MIQSVDKALRVFEFVCRAAKDARVVDIAKALDINKATVFRLLRTFVETGYMEQDPDTDRYRPTMKILSLGNSVMNKMEIRGLALGIIKELSEKSGESVHLSIKDGTMAVIIDKVEARTGTKVSFHIGRRSDLYSTGTGKVFLAHLPLNRLEDYLAETPLDAHTPMTIVDRTVLKRQLDEIRESGFSVDRQENNTGISCVAAPVRNYSDEVVASVSLTGPSVRIEHNIPRLSELILDYSSRISRKLGYHR